MTSDPVQRLSYKIAINHINQSMTHPASSDDYKTILDPHIDPHTHTRSAGQAPTGKVCDVSGVEAELRRVEGGPGPADRGKGPEAGTE